MPALSRTGRDDLLAGMARNFEIFDPLDVLAELSWHIPDKGEHPIRYYGVHSNKARAKKAARTPTGMTPATPPGNGPPIPSAKLARRRWAALIQRVYHADPLLCPQCGATIPSTPLRTGTIIACIEAHQGTLVEAILRHVGLWHDPPARSPPFDAPDALAAPAEPAVEVDPDFLERARLEQMEITFQA